MRRRACFVIAVVVAAAGGVASADPDLAVEAVEDDVAEPVRRSYVIPAIETVAGDIVLSTGLMLAGVSWAQITPDTMWRNLTGDWAWDTDPFTTNQLFHPYMGAMAHTTARSNGLGFWTSTIYAFAGSLLWEAVLENEPPSINDQITTPVGGVLLGEMFHRAARILRRRPGFAREAAAAVVDWPGAINGRIWGSAWRERPPRSFGYVAVGWTGLDAYHDGGMDSGPAHDGPRILAGAALTYGLVGDPRFRLRRPLDHFDFRASIDASSDDLAGDVHLRGILHGSTYGRGGVRGLWGVYSTYDFVNPQRVRVGAIGVGIGSTAQVELGDRGFGEVTVVSGVIPYGAAGSAIEHPGTERDYRRGIGASQIVELKLGATDFAVARVTGRAFEIIDAGEGSEIVAYVDGGVIMPVWSRHAIGIELGWAMRRATFDDDVMDLFDQHAELRVFYALINDGDLGGAR